MNAESGLTVLVHHHGGFSGHWESPPVTSRAPSHLLCGPDDEDTMSGQEGGKEGGKLSLRDQRLDFLQSRDPFLQEVKIVCGNTKRGIRRREQEAQQ